MDMRGRLTSSARRCAPSSRPSPRSPPRTTPRCAPARPLLHPLQLRSPAPLHPSPPAPSPAPSPHPRSYPPPWAWIAGHGETCICCAVGLPEGVGLRRRCSTRAPPQVRHYGRAERVPAEAANLDIDDLPEFLGGKDVLRLCARWGRGQSTCPPQVGAHSTTAPTRTELSIAGRPGRRLAASHRASTSAQPLTVHRSTLPPRGAALISLNRPAVRTSPFSRRKTCCVHNHSLLRVISTPAEKCDGAHMYVSSDRTCAQY